MIAVKPYTENEIPAVKGFNLRLSVGGVLPEFHFPEDNIPGWLPKLNGRSLYQEFYLAVDNENVRGAYILKFQDFSFRGELRAINYYHQPVSEGIVNKTFAPVGVLMLRSAMKARPLLFCLGMGGFDRPLPQMLKAMGWRMCAVPFFFKVNRAARFLREIGSTRQTTTRRLLARLGSLTGTGWLGINALQAIHAARFDSSITTDQLTSFGDWTDELWRTCNAHYSMIACRDSANLKLLYSPGKSFLSLKITRGEQVLGWAVVLDTQMRNNRHFGDLRVGSIVDCLAVPDNASAVIQAAARFLQDRGVDLIVCNHSHAAWTSALKSAGFLPGPSNFIFAVSPPLSELIAPFESNQNQLYLMRGDGDGPVNL
jgi:hypothetical protein